MEEKEKEGRKETKKRKKEGERKKKVVNLHIKCKYQEILF